MGLALAKQQQFFLEQERAAQEKKRKEEEEEKARKREEMNRLLGKNSKGGRLYLGEGSESTVKVGEQQP